ncbi:WxL domain-containing protein, partial [Enterococcus hulanensis]
VTANAGEGTDTWQLRIPFNKVSLNLPANAGKKNTTYSAALTWSLDDTP